MLPICERYRKTGNDIAQNEIHNRYFKTTFHTSIPPQYSSLSL